MTSKRAISGAFTGVALLLGTTCSASVGADKFMDEENVERQIFESLTKQTGTKPDKIDCPGDLMGKVDATMKCTMTSGGSEYARSGCESDGRQAATSFLDKLGEFGTEGLDDFGDVVAVGRRHCPHGHIRHHRRSGLVLDHPDQRPRICLSYAA
ncbi:DUF4333 domain-containing protein [Nocardioides sp. NPDC127514]|uniref:DUF4333 domain-containing protein n=1 Tax=unclassified Nocardioides TaxID=2615069 RepID=UPI0033221E4D